ncbi:MAG: hypothetical protein LUD74_04515 [Tannerellaceae bacterium]|nr:hypothetical protein [Tannerellaceae bacterium]
MCLGIFSCSDKDENKDGYGDLSCNVKAVKGNPESIVGKWKLMKSYGGFDSRTVDYSCKSIICEFYDGNSVIITNENPHDSFYWEMQGEHMYEFSKSEDGDYYQLIIGNSVSCFSTLTATQLVWEHRSLDGVDYVFARVE